MRIGRKDYLFGGLFIASLFISTNLRDKNIKGQVKELMQEDTALRASVLSDTVFVESGFNLDLRESDSAKVVYLKQIGYFDVLVVGDTVVLVPKTINKMLTQHLKATVDSLAKHVIIDKARKKIIIK